MFPCGIPIITIRSSADYWCEEVVMINLEETKVLVEYALAMTDMIAKLFRHCGYSVTYGAFLTNNCRGKGYVPDLLLEKDGQCFIVEIKSPRSMFIAQPFPVAERFFAKNR